MKKDIVAYARSLGFERVGIASAEPLKREEAFLKRWIAEGRAGEMDYLEREPERRSRPAELLAGAKSVIAMAMNYGVPSPRLPRRPPSPARGEGTSFDFPSPLAEDRALHIAHSAPSPGSFREGGRRPDEGKISRYANGRDYHKVLGKRLESFVRYLQALAPGIECRTFVDTGPLLERAFAQRAGLGFIGKNTMLITKGLGSWVFLASVITTLELSPDASDDRSCGECRLCIDACPTQAITSPFTLDARRCIAYLTIEQEGSIQEDLREKTGGWVFGCDICQEVCPHNTPNRHSPRSLAGNPWIPGQRPPGMTTLKEILEIQDDLEFRKRFTGTAIMRSGRVGLVRNACLAAANLGRRDLITQLEKLSRQDPHTVVREQAAWALQRLSPLPLP